MDKPYEKTSKAQAAKRQIIRALLEVFETLLLPFRLVVLAKALLLI